jgi:hypothetical protein
MSGIKSIFSSIKSGTNWETIAFFVLSLYLFVSSFFYYTGATLFLLALAFAGIFIGLATHAKGEKRDISISYANDHRKSFFFMLFIVLIMISSVTISFKFVERLVSVSYFKRALSAQTIPVAEDSISQALAFYQNDLYLRTYAEIYMVKFNSIASKEASLLSDADKVNLQANLDQAVNGAQLAIRYNPENYLNFQTLGSVYRGLASFGVKDAYSKAIEAYKTASILNPLNPGIKLDLANVANMFGNKQEAKDYANSALALKVDYIDAYILLSQIAKNENDNTLATSYAQTALSLSPLNKDLIKFVDSIKNENITVTPATKKP